MKSILAYYLVCLLVACSQPEKIKTPVSTKHSSPPDFRKKVKVTYIQQDSLIKYLAASKKISSNKDAGKPFGGLGYNKVIAYNYDGTFGEHIKPIVSGNVLASTIKQQASLTQQQADYITTVLGADISYGNSPAFCFEPHLGLVFFADSEIVEHISICLICNKLQSSKPIPATWAKKITVTERGSKYPADGFSKTGANKIFTFFKKKGLDPYVK